MIIEPEIEVKVEVFNMDNVEGDDSVKTKILQSIVKMLTNNNGKLSYSDLEYLVESDLALDEIYDGKIFDNILVALITFGAIKSQFNKDTNSTDIMLV